jgi:chemotaxis protein CheZ
MKILFRVEDELKHVLQDGELPDPVAAMTGTTEALAGVQVPDRALQQDDVDDLLASLGF